MGFGAELKQADQRFHEYIDKSAYDKHGNIRQPHDFESLSFRLRNIFCADTLPDYGKQSYAVGVTCHK